MAIDIESLRFQKLDYEGVKTLVSWAEAEGWNPGLQDAVVFWKADPDGFVGFYDYDLLVAGGAIVSYSGAFGFMGLFIVRPELRAQGLGRKLWYQRRDMLLSRLKDGAAIGMDGVVAMQPFYHQGGFDIAFTDERYERQGMPCIVSNHVTAVTDADLDVITAYDTECFGFARPQFLAPWLTMQGHNAWKYVVDGELKGFVVLRKAVTGFKIGPLFADDEIIAEELYKVCLDAAVGQPVYLDIPVVNKAAADLVKRYDAVYVFECARMYYGTPPDTDINKVFGITSFELG